MASLPSPTSSRGPAVPQTLPSPSQPSANSSHTAPALTPTSWTFSNVQSTTPAKRTSPSEADRAAKRRSPPYPAATASPTRASSSASPASAESAASVPPTASSPWVPSTSFRHATVSGSHASGPSTSFAQMQAHHTSHSATSATQPTGPTSFAFGGDDASRAQIWTRRHSLATTIVRRPFALSGEPSSAPASSGVALPAQDQRQLTADNRAGPAPNRAIPTSVARSPAFPRGLEQEEAVSDLSILGYPWHLPQPLPPAPERLADRTDEWGLLSELGPVSRTELFNVAGGQVVSPNNAETQVRHAPDVPQDAAGPSEPLVAPAQAASAFVVGQPQGPLPRRPAQSPSPTTADDLRDIEMRLARVQRDHPDLFAPASDASDAASHDPFAHIRRARHRALEAERAQARTPAQEGVDPGSHNDRPQRSAMPGSIAPQTAFASATSQAGQVAAAAPPPPAVSTETRPTPTYLATPAAVLRAVPRVERNNAVRDWRNNIAQQPQLPPSPPWGAQPSMTSAQASAPSSAQAARPDPTASLFGGSASLYGLFEPRALSPGDDPMRHPSHWTGIGGYSTRPDVPLAQEGLSDTAPAGGRQQQDSGHPTLRPLNRTRSPSRLHATWAQIRSAAAPPSGQDQVAAAPPRPSHTPTTGYDLEHGLNPYVLGFALGGPPRPPADPAARARRLAARADRMAEWRRQDSEALARELEPDVAGAPPPAALRPFLLASHAPFRASPDWDESGRPSNRPAEAAGPSATRPRTVPSTASSARATAGDPPAMIVNEGLRRTVPPPPGHAAAVPGTDYPIADGYYQPSSGETLGYGHNWRPQFPYHRGFRLGEYPLGSPTTGRADGGDPVDLSNRTPRRSGTQTNNVQPSVGASGAAQQTERPHAAPLYMRSRHMGGPYGPYVHDALYNQLASTTADPEQRAIRLIACALASEDPSGFIAGKVNSTRDEYRLRPEMTPETRTQLFTRLARATQMFPAMQRRKFMGNVLVRSRWEEAKIEGDKDECCAICQEDYEPVHIVSVTPCNHMYHAHCLEQWIKTPNVSTCPMCRRDLAMLNSALKLCAGGMTVARKLWMETPADLVPVRDL